MVFPPPVTTESIPLNSFLFNDLKALSCQDLNRILSFMYISILNTSPKFKQSIHTRKIICWTTTSAEVVQFQTNKSLRIPLFIKKDDDEGTEFYYMGDITAIDDSYEQIKSDDINLVKMRFLLKHAVSNSIMKYLHS